MGVPYAEVIGDPIAHSKSPLIHKFWLEKLGIDGDYRAVQVMPRALDPYLVSRRGDADWRGCNVTMPLKRDACSLVDRDRSRTGAVNCIVAGDGLLTGWNTDVDGLSEQFLTGLDTSAPCCIIGSGGAARAAIAALDILAVFRVHILARRAEAGNELISEFGMEGRGFTLEDAGRAMKGAVALINASPLGMSDGPPMLDAVLEGLQVVAHRCHVLDMVYMPPRTRLLETALQLRLPVSDGFSMLIGQAARAFQLFFGASAPREHDGELRELLTS